MMKYFDELFDSIEKASVAPVGRVNRMIYSVPTDVKETDKEFIVTMTVAGYKKDDIDINYKDGVLSISGTSNVEDETKEGKYLVKERGSSTFMRNFGLPNVKEKEISAKMEDGILTITLPKEEVAPASKINID